VKVIYKKFILIYENIESISVNRSNKIKENNESLISNDYHAKNIDCANCLRQNTLIEDLYKFINNLTSFMKEQGFKFQNCELNASTQQKISKLNIKYKISNIRCFLSIKINHTIN